VNGPHAQRNQQERASLPPEGADQSARGGPSPAGLSAPAATQVPDYSADASTTLRASIVFEARTWLDTPFHHQGRVKGEGVDCAGLPIGVAKACGLTWADVSGYGRVPRHGVFQAVVQSTLQRIFVQEVQPGDLMVFAWRAEPQHIAIVSQTAPLRIIHAWQDAGRCVENDLDSTWRARLRGCYRWPELVEGGGIQHG